MSAPDARSRILVVDDDPDLCRLVADALSSDGRTVDIAHSRAGALDLVGRKRCDLAFVDVFLPDSELFGLVDELFAAFPDLPVVIMSGYLDDDRDTLDSDIAVSADDVRTMAERKGVRAVLLKPFTVEELRTTADRALSE